jgi:hypothetical protein
LNFAGTVDDRFFPNCTALAIVHVVTLVEHHGFDSSEGSTNSADRRTVEHIPKYFGSHHQNRRISIEGNVTCEQTYHLVSKLMAEVAQLLVGECFEGSGVEDAPPPFECLMDGVFAD